MYIGVSASLQEAFNVLFDGVAEIQTFLEYFLAISQTCTGAI